MSEKVKEFREWMRTQPNLPQNIGRLEAQCCFSRLTGIFSRNETSSSVP
jgi:hypothetical protein